MRLHHLFSASALALGLAFMALTPTAAANEGPDHDHLNCARGPARGAFDLPDAGGPGATSGILFRRDGTPAFRIETVNLPPESPDQPGRIHGFLHTLPKPDRPARRIARIVGRFGVGEEGRGKFRALFLRMDDDTNGDSYRVVGAIHGAFHDPRHAPDAEDPGPFRARWLLCRRR